MDSDPLQAAGAHAAVSPRPVQRALANVALLGVARALALAVATWIANGPGSGGAFLAWWTLLYLPLGGLSALLEQPLTLGLLPKAPSSPRSAVTSALTGALWGAVLVRYLPWLRAVGPIAVVALAVAGLAATVVPPIGVRSRGLAVAGAALLAGLLIAQVALDPEAAYGKRYLENRLTAEQLRHPPPFPGRDPASLSDLEVARAVAETWLRTHPTEGLRWSWEEAVVLEGLLTYADASGDTRPVAYAKRWVEDHQAEAASVILWADAAAPAGTCVRLGVGQAFVERVTRYVREEAPRTRAGALSHVGLLGGGALPPQAWIDTVFMHGVFLNRRFAAREEWAGEEARTLALAMRDMLLDRERGLFRHAGFDLGPLTLTLPIEPMFWARGNAWMLWFLVDHQLTRKARGLEPDPELAKLLEAHAAALVACRKDDALWCTDLLGAPTRDNPRETSASALILAALQRARAGGLLPTLERSALLNGRQALRDAIEWRGGHPTLTGVSTGTMPGFRAYYRAIPLDRNVAHGVGALLLALSQPAPR